MFVRFLAQECPFCGFRVFFHRGQLAVCSVNTGIVTRSPCPDCGRILDPDQWLIIDPRQIPEPLPEEP